MSARDRTLAVALVAIERYKTTMRAATLEISGLRQQLAAEQGRPAGALSDAWAWSPESEGWVCGASATVSRVPALHGWLVQIEGDAGAVYADGALLGMRAAADELAVRRGQNGEGSRGSGRVQIGADGLITWTGEGVGDV